MNTADTRMPLRCSTRTGRPRRPHRRRPRSRSPAGFPGWAGCGGCRWGSVGQQDEQVPRGGAGAKSSRSPAASRGQAVAVPAGGKIPVDVLAVLVGKVLEHPQHGVAPQAAEGTHPHRDAAVGRALGQDGPCAAMTSLTVQAGGGSVQQQVHRKGRVIFLFGAQNTRSSFKSGARHTRPGSTLPLRATRALGC